MKFVEHYFTEALLYKIFLDMDGVICDFEGGFEKLSPNKTFDEYEEADAWKIINDAGVDFWATLPWLDGGKELWNALKPYNPTILSRPSRSKDSITGKIKWIEDNLADENDKLPKYIIETDKAKYSGTNRILIDDDSDNIENWEDADGIGILYIDVKSALKLLQKYMPDLKKELDNI